MRALCLLLVAAAPAAAAEVYDLDPATGTVHAVLRRTGPLQAIGHDHVVEAREFEGQVVVDGSSSSVRFTAPVEWLDVDHPVARVLAGLDGTLKDDDRAKVRDGMRGPKVLDLKNHPALAFESDSIEPVDIEPGLWLVTGKLTLKGVTKTLAFSARLEDGRGGKWFAGHVRFRPSEFGVKPPKVAGGLIGVEDEALVVFRLFGRPLKSP